MRHTPGPWTLNDGTLLQDSGRKLHIGKFSEAPGLGDAAAANARLICAAPAMLAALQSALSDAKPTSRREYWRDSADGKSSELVREETWPDWIAAARAAIRAATGE